MSLWLTITLLLLVAALFIAVPFYIGRNRELEVELFNVAEQANIDVFRDQQAQYQQQFEGGEISAEQQALMLAEAEQLLLSNTASVRQQQDTRQGLWLLPILIIVMSLASIFIYRSLGSAVDQQITESLAEQQSHHAAYHLGGRGCIAGHIPGQLQHPCALFVSVVLDVEPHGLLSRSSARKHHLAQRVVF